MSKKTRIGVVVAVVLALAGGVTAAVMRNRNSKVTVQLHKVAKADITSIVTASGEVKPQRFVNISANVSGRITILRVKDGDVVKKGQVLVRIDSTRFEAGTRQSEAGVQAARADLDRAKADLEAAALGYERTRRMHDEQLVSDQVYEQADADLKVKKAMVDAQRRRIQQQDAALASNVDDLEKTTIPSPMDGVITSLQKEEGEMVIGAQSFSPTVIMTVADLSVMEAEILVDETDIRNVALGQEAKVRVDALEGLEIHGKVTEIGSSAIPRAGTASSSSTNQAKDFKVVITLQDPPKGLRSGLNATADITTARKASVMVVPIQAVVVREVDKQGKVVDPAEPAPGDAAPAGTEVRRSRGEEKEGVFVVSAGKATFRAVKTGIVGETDIEIASGLSEGEEIVSGSYKTLRTLKDESLIKVEEKKRDKS